MPMKRSWSVVLICATACLVACCLFAQDEGVLVPANEEAVGPSGGGFVDVVHASGPIGILNWAGVLFWAVAALPLGVWSVIRCATVRVARLPIGTKLLLCGGSWVFILGWVGAAQGTIGALSYLATGSADGVVLAYSISQALFSLAAAFTVCQVYMFFILVSVVVHHCRQRKVRRDSQSGSRE